MNEEHESIASVGSADGLDYGSPSYSDATPVPARPSRAPQSAPSVLGDANPSRPATPDTLDQSVARINARLASVNRVLVLRVDPRSGLTIAEIRNATTNEVLQQIPSRDLLHLAQMLQSWSHGESALIDMIA